MSKRCSSASEIFLRRKAEFDHVKLHGLRVQHPFFNLMYCQGSAPDSRVGIVVGRRFGNAVVRNRAKRIFRGLVRAIQRELVRGYDVVIFPKKPVLREKFQTVEENWRVALQRIGLLCPTRYQSCPESYSG